MLNFHFLETEFLENILVGGNKTLRDYQSNWRQKEPDAAKQAKFAWMEFNRF